MDGRILAIDDEPVVLGAVSKALKKTACRVDTVDNAGEALNLLANDDYDVVITDLMMPEMDGIELMRRLRDLRITARIIMLTGYPTSQTALQARRLGAFEYVTKPFTHQELLSVVVRALRRGRQDAGEPQSSRRAPGDPYLLPGHSWARMEQDGSARIGMAGVFALGAGKIAELKFPDLNDRLEQGKVCVFVIAADDVEHQLHSPLSGRVIEVNQAVLENPDLAADDPEGSGWLLRLLPEDLQKELQDLAPR